MAACNGAAGRARRNASFTLIKPAAKKKKGGSECPVPEPYATLRRWRITSSTRFWRSEGEIPGIRAA